MGSLSPYIPPIFTILQEYHNITRVLTNVKVSSLAAVKYFLNALFVKKNKFFVIKCFLTIVLEFQSWGLSNINSNSEVFLRPNYFINSNLSPGHLLEQ